MTRKLPWEQIIGYGILGLWLLNIARKNGGTLQGNPEGVKIRIDRNKFIDAAIPFFIQNPLGREALKIGIKEFINGMGHD